jgi:peptide/nickel transport system substrate-binding protein/oligopeptide transport system substrate-binding protein
MQFSHPRLRACQPYLTLLLLTGLVLGGSACRALPDSGSSARPALTPGAPLTGTPALPTVAPDDTPAATAPAVAAPTYTLAPESGDQQLTMIGGADDPPTLDPALASDSQSLFVVRQLFSGLVRLDDSLNVVPDLAAALPSVSADGKIYTFTLRKDARWPDGQTVTADDVAYSIERATDPALAAPAPGSSLPAALYLTDIVGVEDKLAGKAPTVAGMTVVDAATIRFTLTGPRAVFLARLTAGPGFVVDRRNVAEGGAAWYKRPAGTGPFRLREWLPHDSMTLVPNPAYYGGAPRLAQVTLLLGANAAGGLVQYEQGVVDLAEVGTGDLARVSDPASPLSTELVQAPELSTTYIGFNVTMAPFDDPQVREAFSLVIDRTKIAQVMFNERVRAARGLVPPDMPGYQSQVTPPALDVTRARQLLAESAYHGSANLPRVTFYTTGSDIGPMVQAVLKQTLGVEVELRALEWSDYLDGLSRRQFPMYLLTWSADWPDPSSFLDSLFRSGSPQNCCAFADAQVDEALDAAQAEQDPAARARAYAALEQTLLEQAPVLPLLHNVTYMLIRPYVHGVRVTPLGILSLRDAYLTSRTGEEDATP